MRQVLKKVQHQYEMEAAARFDDTKNTSLMISKEDHKLRNEVMRRNVLHQIKDKNLHDF